MTTINEVIAKIDEWKPNAVPQEQKAQWLLNLDGRIYEEVLRGRPAPADPGAEKTHREPPRAWPEDGDKPLLIAAPYEDIYFQYVQSLMDFTVKDTGSYYNSSALFEQSFNEWKVYYHRTHRPAADPAFRVMG